MYQSPVILTFSHLRWDFVYQRPQHLLSRLAKNGRVIFIEEPVFDPSKTFFECATPEPNVLVCRPHTSLRSPGYADDQIAVLKPMVDALVSEEKLQDYILWFYTPMALPLAEGLQPLAMVYDCMDELSKFLHAPPQLLQREEQLLKMSDVVFTGGPSLYRA